MADPWDSAVNKSDWYLPQTTCRTTLSQEISLKDADRKIELVVNVIYPKPENGKKVGHYEHVQFPVVLFSPIVLGGKDCYRTLANNIASSGYIVIVISHLDNIKLQRKKKGMGWMLKEGGPKTCAEESHNMTFALHRICDIQFIIDSLPIINLSVVNLRGHIQSSRILFIGHSFGSFPAMIAAGCRIALSEKELRQIHDCYKPTPSITPSGITLYSWNFPSIVGAIILSPIGPGMFGMTEESFRFIKPTLLITGTKDTSIGKVYAKYWKETPHRIAEQNEIARYMLVLAEVDHGFGNITESSVLKFMSGWNKSMNLQEYLTRSIIAFIDAYILPGTPLSAIALSWLEVGLIRSLDHGIGKVEISPLGSLQEIPKISSVRTNPPFLLHSSIPHHIPIHVIENYSQSYQEPPPAYLSTSVSEPQASAHPPTAASIYIPPSPNSTFSPSYLSSSVGSEPHPAIYPPGHPKYSPGYL